MDSGNHDQTATKISRLKGMSSVEVHIGNSDIVAHVLYKNTKELLNLLVHLKKWRELKI